MLSGHGMQTNTTKFVATLNCLWDGNSFIAHKKSTRGFTIAQRRVTINLMLQPEKINISPIKDTTLNPYYAKILIIILAHAGIHKHFNLNHFEIII